MVFTTNAFSFDPILWSFIEGNYFTITLLLVGLKTLAKATPWAGDDKIYTMLSEMFGAFKRTKANNEKKGKSRKEV